MTWWLNIRRHILVITLVIIYLAADLVLTGREIYVFNLLPVLILIIYLTLARLDLMYFIVIFLTPLSVQLIDFLPSSSVDFWIPTEPLLFGIMIVFYYKIVLDRSLDARIINHPVTFAILFNLFWLLFTSVTSTMTLVSFKFLLARTWFITVYYLLAILVFRKMANIRLFIWCYAISLMGVVVFTIIMQVKLGIFNKQVATYAMAPFFRDHTSYGAVLAMLIFGLGGVILHKGGKLFFRIIIWSSWVLLIAGLVLSYTRAAWISVLISFGVLGLTLWRVRFRYILIAGVVALLYFGGQRTAIIQKMQRNRQDSSSSIVDHLRSISNITTDESNLERINRWNSALRMFRERPVLGWGPGTFIFKYAPFQKANEKTMISTDFGDHGNAHSEYIGPLAESGILGSLSFILIGILSLITGFRVYQKINNKPLKHLILSLILGLITYLVHGTLNNFLDTDKVSAVFWGFIAIFVSLDIYYPQAQGTGSVSEKFNTQH
jgi:putative inorganic carbon (hco3(-)) transporter